MPACSHAVCLFSGESIDASGVDPWAAVSTAAWREENAEADDAYRAGSFSPDSPVLRADAVALAGASSSRSGQNGGG